MEEDRTDPPNGSPRAVDSLMPQVYEELRRIADGFFRGRRRGHTLQPTALVHEAYVRMAGLHPGELQGRTHFLHVAARAMRQVLVDHVRRRRAAKRGGDAVRVALDDVSVPVAGREVDLLDLLDAIEQLSGLNPRHARIVVLRFLGGLTVGEVSEELGVSKRTVEHDWQMARAWLLSRLRGAL